MTDAAVPAGEAPFTLRRQDRPDHVRVLVAGELDLHREPELREFTGSVLAELGRQPLVLDLTGLQFLDSSGLRGLLVARDRARAAGVPFSLSVAPGPVTRLLDLAGVRSWFQYEDPLSHVVPPRGSTQG